MLFGRHRDRLWAVALRTCGNPEEAADALQDAMISAFRRAETFRGDAQVTTWLHRIVVNACLDRMRRRKVRAAEVAARRPRGVRRTRATSPPPRTPPSRWPPASARAAQQVLAALRPLPADQRAALVLVDMQGYPVEEAAPILECRRRHREEPVLPRPGPARAAAGDVACVTRRRGTGTSRTRRASTPVHPDDPTRPRPRR